MYCIWSVLKSSTSLSILAMSFSFSFIFFKIESLLLNSEFSLEIVPINSSFGSLGLNFCSFLLGSRGVLPYLLSIFWQRQYFLKVLYMMAGIQHMPLLLTCQADPLEKT